MLTRRDFFEAAAVMLPLASCAKNTQAPEAAMGNLSPKQLEDVRKEAAQFETALNALRKADVPYAIAPRFYPQV